MHPFRRSQFACLSSPSGFLRPGVLSIALFRPAPRFPVGPGVRRAPLRSATPPPDPAAAPLCDYGHPAASGSPSVEDVTYVRTIWAAR